MAKSNVNFNPQAPTVTGFLGGVTFTALILLFEKADAMTIMIPHTSIKVVSILIPLTAIVSFLFILGTLGSSRAPADDGSVHDKFFKMVLGYIIAGFIGLMIIIPIVVIYYTWIGAIVVAVIEIITAAILVKEANNLPKLW